MVNDLSPRREQKRKKIVVKAGDEIMIFFGILIALYMLVSIFAPWVAPYDPGDQNLGDRFMPPLTPGHVLGTDNLGRDILSRLIFGGRISLAVGLFSIVMSGIIGTTLGLVAGYFGGILDDVINWLVNVQLAFPFVLLAISVVIILGPSMANIIILLVISGWPEFARLIRAKVLSLRSVGFVEAAVFTGVPEARIIFRHILPNTASSVLVLLTLGFAKMIIAEAALSFLGLGPGGLRYSSWGLMLAEGKDYLVVAWWVATMPGLAIVTIVLSVNILGDWFRDKLDPKLRI
jgi:peptide/nickel transport system permease protein